MSIEGSAQSGCSCSFRSTTDYRSPINGLSEINRFELFYKHCIPTGFPDRLLKRAHDLSITRDPGALPLAITFHAFSVKPQRVCDPKFAIRFRLSTYCLPLTAYFSRLLFYSFPT